MKVFSFHENSRGSVEGGGGGEWVCDAGVLKSRENMKHFENRDCLMSKIKIAIADERNEPWRRGGGAAPGGARSQGHFGRR